VGPAWPAQPAIATINSKPDIVNLIMLL